MTDYIPTGNVNTVPEINSELEKISLAMSDQLDRNPSTGQANQMNTNLDMNSNRVINVPTPILPQDGVNKAYVDTILSGFVSLEPGATLLKIGTPDDFGAVGDGVTDDTVAVQAAYDALDITIHTKWYGVTSVTANSYITMFNGGGLRSVGLTDSRMLTINAPVVGDLNVDGNERSINCILFPEGLGFRQRYNTIQYKGVKMDLAGQPLATGVTMFGDFVSGGHISGKDMDNNGYPNGSFPQGVATGGGIYHIESHYLENGASGLVPTGLKSGETVFNASGQLYCGFNHTTQCTDNGAYLLGGYVSIRENLADREEESVQINAVRGADLGRIVARGRTLGAFNIQNTLGPVNIGEVVGEPELGADYVDYPTKVPTAVGFVRSGNTACNRVTVGSVKGFFQLGFAFGVVGSIEQVAIDNVDITLCYKPSAAPLNAWSATPSSNNWFDFSAVDSISLRNIRIRVQNFEVTTFPTTTAFSTSYNVSAVESVVDNLQISFIEEDGSYAASNVELRSSAPLEGLKIYGGHYLNIGGTTYNTRPELCEWQRDSINSIPLTGYWEAGARLNRRSTDQTGVTHYENRTLGANDWYAIGGIITGSGSPVGSVTPDYVGQTYRDTGTNNLWQAFGNADTNWNQTA